MERLKKVLRQITGKLKGTRKALKYLSIHMEKQKSKHEELEAKLNEHSLKYDIVNM